ncbi:MAG TPA: hypothetical protein VGM10_17410 [Actinocrinis sp.]|jgi:hypothetical protein
MDKVLLAAVCFAVAWALTNGVYLAQRAIKNRSVISVHTGSGPAVMIDTQRGEQRPSLLLRKTLLTGEQTAKVSVSVANDGPDGITVGAALLTGPYLSGAVKLAAAGQGYVGAGTDILMTGIVTVNCTAAARVGQATIDGRTLPDLGLPTSVSFPATDADGATHQENLTIDTDAYALQSQVCTK